MPLATSQGIVVEFVEFFVVPKAWLCDCSPRYTGVWILALTWFTSGKHRSTLTDD